MALVSELEVTRGAQTQRVLKQEETHAVYPSK